MLKELGFQIIPSSDLQYEKFCAEIYFNREFVAIITQEDGIENAILEIDPKLIKGPWSFSCSEFLEVLKKDYKDLE